MISLTEVDATKDETDIINVVGRTDVTIVRNNLEDLGLIHNCITKRLLISFQALQSVANAVAADKPHSSFRAFDFAGLGGFIT